MLHTLPAAPTMLELGAYWAHYSMWLKKARPNSQVWMVEPDTTSIEAGRANFQRNGYKGTFIQDFVGNGHFQVDTFLGDFGAQNLDILHCDIQGFEIEMLKGAHHSLETNKINHLFISTHSQEIHMEICRVLTSYNYGIEIDSDFSFDSTSYDGLVVASRPGLTLFEEGNFIGRNKILGASPKLLLDTLSKLYNVRSLVN